VTGALARLYTKKRPHLHAVLNEKVSKITWNRNYPSGVPYRFGGVLAGALGAGAAGLLAGDVPGLAGFGATLPAAGAATPD